MLKDTQLNTVIDKHKCTMCGACHNVCPVKAIEIKEDADGFAYPCIDKKKCTNCGLCTKKCPALHPQKTSEIVEKLPTPICYGGYSKNDDVREKSSSGGVFSILADYVLSKGGYVCGAKFVKGATLEHVIINKKENLAPLRGSKYVQSNVNDVYKKIKKLLEKDNYVLFTGTPCQVAALYQVLGKDYEKLLTVDLLCHGCPSQKIFKEYLNEVTNGNEQNISDIKFRYKKNGWRNFWMSIKWKNNTIEFPATENTYYNGFEKNILIRKSCTDCHFNRLPRQGDFTLGDFWGVEHQNKDIDDNKGTSAILVNTTKAQNILTEIKSDFQALKNVPQKNIQDFNMVEWKSYPHPHRTYFFSKYQNKNYTSITKLIDESLNKNDGICCLNYHYAKENYGSVFVGYALQERLRKMGYSPVNIIYYDTEKIKDLSNLYDFTKEYIDETEPCYNQEKLKNLNKYFKTFIVGSDGVWSDAGFLRNFYNNMFDFVDFSKNICSFAASFGNNKLDKFEKGTKGKIPLSEKEILHRKYLLKRFNHVSVREEEGVNLCKKVFNINAQRILDTVFLLDTNEWKKIINKSDREISSDNIALYIHDKNDIPSDIKEKLSKLDNVDSLWEGTNFADMYQSSNYTYSGVKIEDWLATIYKSKLLITNSFHGCCFAIIFNKPFIVFPPKMLGTARITSLLKMFGLENRMVSNLNEFNKVLTSKDKIDWKIVNEILSKKKKEQDIFLDTILASHNSEDKTRSYLEALELRMELNELQQKGDTPPYYKQKLYLFGLPLIKTKIKNGKKKVYFLGLHLITISEKKNTRRYKLLGIELLKRKNK